MKKMRGIHRAPSTLDRFVLQFEIARDLGKPPPSYQELSHELKIPYSSVRDVVLALVAEGRLVREEGIHRGVRLP
jgi:hypothetical protein